MKNTALALVAVILSTLSGASLAAHSAGTPQPTAAVVTSNVTGSTTRVSLDGQLTVKPPLRQATLRTASLWGQNEANGIAISDR